MPAAEEKPGLFTLKNTSYNPQTFYLLSFVSFILLVINLIIFYYSINEFVYIALLPIFLFLFIYVVGSSYSENQAKFDYIKTTTTGFEYHHSPIMMHMGWLPHQGFIKFSEIQSINVIQIKSGLNLLEERMKQAQFQVDDYLKSVVNKQLLLEIVLKNGEIVRIGERLSSSGLIQVAVFIESGAKLGNLLASFAEKFPNAAGVAKNLYNKFFKKET